MMISSSPAPTYALCPTSAEVGYAFMTESLALNGEQQSKLRRLGISDAAIDRDPGYESAPIRTARVVSSGRCFDFASEPEGTSAYVTVARDWRGDSSDIVAFNQAGRVAPWIGREALLGAHHVLSPRFEEPLRVFSNIWDWLRSDRDGVVILDWRRAAGLLEGVTLVVADAAFAGALRRQLTRAAPPILVRVSEKVAA
jgi:hypothetical protein